MRVRVRKADSLLHELDVLQHRVASRAHEFFEHRGGAVGLALEDWIHAEREVAWRPPVEVLERDGEIVVAFAVPGVDPADLDVLVSDDDVVVTATGRHEHPEGAVVHTCEFPVAEPARKVALPVRIVSASARADCQHGMLRVTAARAPETSRRLHVSEAASALAPEHRDEEC